MRWVVKANLPENPVTVCAVSAVATEEKAALERMGIEVIAVEPSPLLAPPVASHADMLLHHLGSERLFTAQRNTAHCRRLEELGFVLLDAGAGDGKTFDWDLLENFSRPYFLAGGLDPDNVREAIERCRPYAVDVSSGIETDGFKDEAKMQAFVSNVRKTEP